MKSKIIKIASLMTGLCICFASTYYSYAVEGVKINDTKKSEATISSDNEEMPYKDETVYILANADGSVSKIIVSDYIKNCMNADDISDYSELKNITNVKGDEKFTEDGNSIVWDAQGNDIYYQGNINKELPVTLKITYSLNDKEISPEKLAGKSGKVKIDFTYINNQYEMVKIGGREEKIYVPFVMLTGLMLDNDVFSNVEMTNGKMINDGDRNICIGYALPGMQENLGINKDVFDIPEGFSITADVKKFKLGMTVTVATSGVFNEIDTSKIDTSNIDDSIRKLSDGLDELIDGTSKLYGGILTLSKKSGKLVSGMNELASGVEKLKDGAHSAYNGAADVDNGVGQISENVGKLDNGVGALADGSAALYNGLDTITQNNDALNAGAKKVFEGLIANVSSSFSSAGIDIEGLTTENYETKLNALLTSPDETQQAQMIALASAGIDAKFAASGIPSTYFNACKYLLATGKSEAEIGAALTENPALIASAAQTAETNEGKYAINMLCLNAAKQTLQPKVTEAISSLNEYKTFAAGLKAYTDGVSAAKSGAQQISANLGTLKAGTAALNNGVLQLKDGTVLLKGGLYQLANGTDTLFDGVLTIKDGMPQLISGIEQLKDGAKALNDGIKTFKNEGIGKILSVYNGDLKGLIARIKATVEVSKNYKSFSGIDELSDGSVKFIYRTEGIK